MEFTKGELRTISSYWCGCRIVTNEVNDYLIDYCPKHKAAPDLYEALKEVKKRQVNLNFELGVIIDEALAKII